MSIAAIPSFYTIPNGFVFRHGAKPDRNTENKETGRNHANQRPRTRTTTRTRTIGEGSSDSNANPMIDRFDTDDTRNRGS
jgi:hypothetical protein